jgi:hypothetical protein
MVARGMDNDSGDVHRKRQSDEAIAQYGQHRKGEHLFVATQESRGVVDEGVFRELEVSGGYETTTTAQRFPAR